MRPPFYVRQLRRDLDEWIKRGLVPESSREAILESAGAGQGMSFASILGILGAILIGAAAMSFVADNWERMPKLARLMVLFGGMWLAFGLGWFLTHGRPVLSQAFVLLGVLLFGANIMLVAQTYHINAHFPDGILLWAGGAMAAAALIPSRASLALAIGLGALWTHYEHFDFDKALHWQYLGFWALGVATAIVLNWRPAIQLSAVALIYWAIISTEGLRLLLGWSEVEAAALYVLIPLVLWAAANALRPQAIGGALTVEHYAFFVFLVAGFILHFIDRNTAVAQSWMVAAGLLSFGALGLAALGTSRGTLTITDLAAVVFIAAAAVVFVNIADRDEALRQLAALVATIVILLWGIARGTRIEDRYIVNLSIFGFACWFLYAYFAVFNRFLEQSVFFGIGGLLLIGLSIVLENIRRRLLNRQATAKPEQGASS